VAHRDAIVKTIAKQIVPMTIPGCWALDVSVVALTIQRDEPVVLTLDGQLPTVRLGPSDEKLEAAVRRWFATRSGLDLGPAYPLRLRERHRGLLWWGLVGLLPRLDSNASGTSTLRVYDAIPHLDQRTTRPPSRATLEAGELHLLAEALDALRARVTREPVLAPLLATTFTLPAMIRRTEAILGQHLHTPNARRRLLESGVLEPTGLRIRQRTGRPADLWRLAPGSTDAGCYV
jgi:hypothetical protein